MQKKQELLSLISARQNVSILSQGGTGKKLANNMVIFYPEL